MAERAPTRTRPSRAQPRWPPSAEPQGFDLSSGAVLLIVIGLTSITHLLVITAPMDRGPSPYVRWMVLTHVVEVIAWIGVVVGLGWRRAAGLVVGSSSLWGILPLVVLSMASLLAADRVEEAWLGPGLQFGVAFGVLVGAFTEEVAFRGFLLHGLARRLGGSLAVLGGSAVFAVYHLPVLIREDIRGAAMVVVLVSHFAFGVFMCRVRAQTGSIWFPSAIHTLWNLAVFDIALWSFPDGGYPTVFGWIKLVVLAMGLFLAYGLYLRATLVRTARGLVTGRSALGGPAAPPMGWRTFYELLAQAPSEEVFDRFTHGARRSVILAEEEARSEGARRVGTEHLLVALIHESDGVTSQALEEVGVPTGSRTRLEELIRDRADRAPMNQFDMRARMTLQLAIVEAEAWNHPHVGTEHLTLGVTAMPRSAAARVLRKAGVDRDRLRRTVVRLLTERAWSVPGEGSESWTEAAGSVDRAGTGSGPPGSTAVARQAEVTPGAFGRDMEAEDVKPGVAPVASEAEPEV